MAVEAVSTIAPSTPSDADLLGADAGLAPSWQRRAVDAALPVGLIVAVSLASIVGHDPYRPGGRAVLVAVLGLTALAALLRRFRTARLGVAFVVILAAFALPWQVNWWPLPGALGVLAFTALEIATGAPLPSRSWLGRLNRSELVAATAIAAVATTALLIFHAMAPPGLAFGKFLLTQVPGWTIGVGGLAFVTVNAAVEEILFRGVILSHLRPLTGLWPALGLQAIGFGLLNLHGYPYGVVGVLLTTAFGLLLGLLRLKAGGLLACWIAHTVADAVIFVFILHDASFI